MSLDTSVLAPVLAHYGITLSRCRPAGGTAGRTWQVLDGDQRYFVRRRGARTSSPERIAFDQGLRHHLAAHGFCATPPLPTREGHGWIAAADGVYEVYPWVDGLGLNPELAELGRRDVAITLARFHTIAAEYSNECEARVPQFGHYQPALTPRRRFDHPAALLAAVDQISDRYSTPANRDSFERARECVVWYGEVYGDSLYQRLLRGVIHGDFNGCNLLFHPDGRVAGVFDYDWAWRDTRVRDVGEGIFFFGARRGGAPDGGSIWSLTSCPEFTLDSMVEFLRAYHAASPLSSDELRAAPLAMLGRWIACRTEGVMKVPEERRAAFLLADFEIPFDWYRAEATALQERTLS